MSSVGLPDGVVVQARAVGGPRQRRQPTFGVYLCGRRSRGKLARVWTGTWRAVWLDWPARGVPSDTGGAVAALVEAHLRAARGELVDIACDSGRGRTGTALAALAVRGGMDVDEAVAWVRGAYPPARLITARQRRWLHQSAAALREPVPA